MNSLAPLFEVTLACDAADLRAAQRLRYEVFVRELGGDGVLVDHDAGLERDRFDEVSDHLILRDISRPRDEGVVGVYRLMNDAAAGPPESDAEFARGRLEKLVHLAVLVVGGGEVGAGGVAWRRGSGHVAGLGGDLIAREGDGKR